VVKQTMFKLLVIVAMLVSTTLLATENDFSVTVSSDLFTVADEAKKRHVPVMMFFAAEDCEFCERLEADYLAAMSHSDEYKDKVIIRKVMIDSYQDINDFSGKSVSAETFSNQFNIQVTPTLMLVNHEGKKLTKNIVGYNRSGFFGAYLDEAIDSAHQRIH